jgi:methyl-accepting chemotaxis protein
MRSEKSVLSKIMLSVVLPVALIFCATVGISMMIVSQNSDAFSDFQGTLYLINAIGLIIIIGLIYFGLKSLSGRVARLAELTARLSQGESLTGVHPDQASDQLGEISIALANLAENMKLQAIQAQKLADGELSVAIAPASQNDLLGKSLALLQKSLCQMTDYFGALPELVSQDDLSKLTPADTLAGAYQKAMTGAQQAVTAVVETRDYYLAIIDALPYRVTTTDTNMKMVFVNKILEDLMKITGTASNRSEIRGVPCNSCNLEMCNTEHCGVTMLNGDPSRLSELGHAEYHFEFLDRYYRMDTMNLVNKKGEKIGYVEVSHDTTPTMSVNNFSKTEVIRLADNLRRMAAGNLALDLEITEAREYTREIYQDFKGIGDSLVDVKNTIGSLIDDAKMLTHAAVEGRLDARADESKFSGSWKELIGGMNGILEEIAKPLDEVSAVMDEISNGNLSATVVGAYSGSFDELKQSVNNMGEHLKIIVSQISLVTNEISNGNLNLHNVEAFGGDFNDISNALNNIIATLNNLLGDINHAAEQVNSGATQVSDSSQALAQGSTEQASSIQELTASITEIAGQTKQNATDSNKATQLATDVMANAERGTGQMAEMQRSMVAINKSSEDISKIIKVIDDIAFQTNILALNAAVEAARAGQHGKGFAVVAEEVRTLAARSAEAAKETTGLIEGSIDKVQEGTKIANETADALDEIVGGITKVNDLIGNIAKASNEQATGIAQINMGVEQVAQVVQQNSATAEQSAAASEELSGQSVLLKNMIDQFKLRA